MHPNWIGLSCSDISLKQFIREKGVLPENREEKKYVLRSNNDGVSIKNFYLDIVSGDSHISKYNHYQPTPVVKKKTIIPKRNDEKPSERVKCMFLSAAQNNDINSLNQILHNYPLVLNSTDDFGWSALMCAVQSSAVKSINYLINNGANKYIKDKSGRTAFTLTKSSEIIKLLNMDLRNDVEKKQLECDKTIKATVFCESCKEEYDKSDERQHITSTIHIFNSKKKFPTYYGISETNRGFQLLLRKGWNKEMGLGPDGSGKKFPVKTVFKIDRCGFGAKNNISKITHFNANDTEAISSRIENKRTCNKRRIAKEIKKEKHLEKKLREELS